MDDAAFWKALGDYRASVKPAQLVGLILGFELSRAESVLINAVLARRPPKNQVPGIQPGPVTHQERAMQEHHNIYGARTATADEPEPTPTQEANAAIVNRLMDEEFNMAELARRLPDGARLYRLVGYTDHHGLIQRRVVSDNPAVVEKIAREFTTQLLAIDNTPDIMWGDSSDWVEGCMRIHVAPGFCWRVDEHIISVTRNGG